MTWETNSDSSGPTPGLRGSGAAPVAGRTEHDRVSIDSSGTDRSGSVPYQYNSCLTLAIPSWVRSLTYTYSTHTDVLAFAASLRSFAGHEYSPASRR